MKLKHTIAAWLYGGPAVLLLTFMPTPASLGSFGR